MKILYSKNKPVTDVLFSEKVNNKQLNVCIYEIYVSCLQGIKLLQENDIVHFDLKSDNILFDPIYNDTKIIDLNNPVIFDDGSLKITAFEVEHLPVYPSLGFRFDYKGRSIVISGDTDYSTNLIEQSKNADLLFHDALSYNMIGRAEDISEIIQPQLSRVFYDIQGYHASPVEAAQAANEANVKELIFYHLIPAPDSFIAKIIFVKGVSEVRPDNWTLADDGTMAILPDNSEDITITNIE